ncbi:putative bifunctional diguanylate cyclase/phosphodiesterase [Alishewanella sp. HL-SH05]|uniref:putative bifunctional diguanylate cyclase/phosphodiesterase n=1 Tax=Alishewanella sp. HL-SH05 TaxID=3461145 RepID=UPI0040434E0A
MAVFSAKESLNRTILDNIMDAVVSIDKNGLITYCNQTALTLFGYKEANLLGKNIKCLMVDYHAEHHDNYLRDYRSNLVKRVIGNTRVLQAKNINDELIPIELRVCQLEMEDGTAYLGMIRDLRDSISKREKIHLLENTDLLTGLPNRNALVLALNDSIDGLVINKQNFYLLMIDADDFSKINQAFGYEYGDEVLRKTAEKLSKYKDFRLIARSSQDEFGVLFQSELPQHEIKRWLTEVLCQLSTVETIINRPISCSFSGGIYNFNQPNENSQNAIGYAENALKFAKQLQRGGLVFHSNEIDQEQRHSAVLDQGLKSTQLTEQLFLVYQAQVDEHGQLIGFEALMRWQYQNQLVRPDIFIALAERNGAIYKIGGWLLEQACQFLTWSSTIPEFASCRLSVNVSPKQFAHPNFVPDIIQSLLNHKIDPQRLHLELTERLLLENPAIIVQKMQDLRRYGISFSLDDFGTGYSSLAYIKNLPLSELKIDRSFVKEITNSASDRKIVSTILLLAQGLGLNVVTEGVENLEQLTELKKLGCKQFQGFFFAKPLRKEHLLTSIPQFKADGL